MYFKITDINSTLYKDAMAYVTKRHDQRETNMKSVEEFFGKELGPEYLAYTSAFNAIPQICGIKSDEIIEGMKPAKQTGFIEPNKRTKKGKEIAEFFNKLPNWSFHKTLELFPLKKRQVYGTPFNYPYLDVFDCIILVRIDDEFDPQPDSIFQEITKTEFYNIYNQHQSNNDTN